MGERVIGTVRDLYWDDSVAIGKRVPIATEEAARLIVGAAEEGVLTIASSDDTGTFIAHRDHPDIRLHILEFGGLCSLIETADGWPMGGLPVDTSLASVARVIALAGQAMERGRVEGRFPA
ncbi:hypothetical protein SAMN06297251_10156 [Fulvimarina manganoxydans]|uniref:Uncharacterized protein n=1 Tax=Fulvimarina manganoxydans TaxID=937218 RepID=A0A1W1Y908_9HYPH|nr:hypothetical protein [Fulvimarina manganoxydans]SMC32614.1 hypothetical protein SAMN06297251_10156 [Fulvimarina manganoxydans]